MKSIACSNTKCSQFLLRKSQDGNYRISAKALVFNEDGECMYAVCKSCNTEVSLPLSIDEQNTFYKSATSIRVPFCRK